MNKRKIKGIVVSIMLIMALVITSVHAMAFPEMSISNPNAGNVGVEIDTFISEDVARYIAGFFIEDAKSIYSVTWSDDSSIINTETLYDASETDKIMAYSFELEKGYVVVSAYIDVPNVILEWSDAADPIYESMEVGINENVIYTGALQYYKSGENADYVYTAEGDAILRNDIQNSLENIRSIANIPSRVLETHVEMEQYIDSGISVNGDKETDPVIENPYDYALLVYGEEFTCHEWRNYWEDYVEYHTLPEFKNLETTYHQHCGPTAITNMIIAYGNRYNIDAINSFAASTIFMRTAHCGSSYGYYFNNALINSLSGTPNATAGAFIESAFELHGEAVTVSGRYAITYNSIKNSLSNNCLLYIMADDHNIYGDHHMVCFAYTQLVDSSFTEYHTFLKLIDGHGTNARYVDVSTISDDQYWEVSFE